MNTESDIELQKVRIASPTITILSTSSILSFQLIPSQLQTNLDNAVATYGPASQPVKLIQAIIAEYKLQQESSQLTATAMPNAT